MLDLWPKRKTYWGIITHIKICGSNIVTISEVTISHHVWVNLIFLSLLEYAFFLISNNLSDDLLLNF